MQVFETATATPSARYIKLGDEVRPFVPFGKAETGGLTGEQWVTILSWLIKARREVEHEMRKNPPVACDKALDGGHDWVLIESGCERTWSQVDILETDDDDGRAEGAGRTSAMAHSLSEDAASDGEDYYLFCRNCMAERNVDDVDFS
jgi:hypothetical protein